MQANPDNYLNLIPGQFNLERFFELSADLFCIAGYDGYFKKVNAAVPNTLGYSNQELFSHPINYFVHPEDQEMTGKKRETLHNDQPLLNFENRYLTKSGDVVWLAWTSMPVPEEGLVFAIAKNITHKKKQEEDRNLLLANLTSVNHGLKHLTYTTSHDLRLPVSNLLSVFEMMDISKVQDEETIEFIAMLKMAAEGLKDTLNNYVDILSQKNVLEVNIEEVALDDCLASVLQSLSALILNSGTQVHVNLAEVPQVKFNKNYMESVFLNLITNAIKYARPNHKPIINITSRLHNGVKQLLFADEGIGFDMTDVQDKIFGLNQKFHAHGDSKGIGLYLVYNHITSLGGRIAVESKVGQGTCFTITFRG